MAYQKIFLSFILVLTIKFGSAQNYPQGYFRNPLNLPMSLAGNFGELRANHYHMGLDLRTNKQENYPVYAASDGWVSRVKVEPFGFGKAIYIDHPNGYTTVYAHLNQFFPALEKYIKQLQYKMESWEIFAEIPAGLFPLTRGAFIAYSGNMGGSEAPHLHFEIRKTREDINLNPQLFGFDLADDINPVITKLAMYDRNKSTYEQMPRIFALKKQGGFYAPLNQHIMASSDKISFAISASDTHSGSTNANGIYQAVLFLDGEEQIRFTMDNISYTQTRYLNAHIDYKTRAGGGPWLQHLSELPGYTHSIYTKTKGNGVLDIGDGKIHELRIEVRDVNNNTSSLRFRVEAQKPYAEAFRDTAKIFYPMMLDIAETADCEFYLGENCLYDAAHLGIRAMPTVNPDAVSMVYAIGKTFIPLQDYFLIHIRPNLPLARINTNRVVMQRITGEKKEVKKVSWQNGRAAAKFRDFGNFQLLVDEEPPKFIPLGQIRQADLRNAYQIAITVKDNLETCKNFRAELDGKWLCFSNDKGKTFIYRFDEHCLPGPHELKLHVEDEAGNTAEEIYRFSR